MRVRVAAGVLAVLLVGVAIYWSAIRRQTAEPTVIVPQLAAQIGEGKEGVGVSAHGAVIRWLPLPEEPPLPQLSLEEPPKGGRVKGPVLEQVRVLAAVPDELRPYVESSHFSESGGVEVKLTTGIELRFGNSSQAARKWQAAAGVLADPSITALDYVDLQAPSRPTYYGSGHELPPVPGGGG